MNDDAKVRTAVYRTIDAVNDLMPAGEMLAPNDDTVLIGENATLDSMGFVNFVVVLEEELERELQRGFDIPDLLAMQGENRSSVVSVADLITLLSGRLG